MLDKVRKAPTPAKVVSKAIKKAAEIDPLKARALSRIREVHYRLTGATPLLMNNPAGMRMKVDELTRGKNIPSAEEAAAGSAYRDTEGNLCGQILAVHSSILRASLGLKLGKVSAKRALQAALSYSYDRRYMPLVDPDTDEPLTEYTVHTVRAVVVNAGILRSRAMVPRWAMVATFELDEAHATAEQVLSVLNIAGRAVGLGDWRPDKGGIYGRFTAELLPESEGKKVRAARELAPPKVSKPVPKVPSKVPEASAEIPEPVGRAKRAAMPSRGAKSKALRAMDRAIMAG
jgi:hypothetical protein